MTPSVRALAGAIATLAVLASGSALAQEYPNKPITLIIPWVAGGPTDIVMRAVAESAQKHLGQPIIVENKAGGGGSVGPAQMAATAKPDGYTISQMPDAVYRTQITQKTTYDSQTDFTYIIQLTGYAYGVTVPMDSSFKSWQDVVAFAKANPGKVNYGSAGVGTVSHVAGVYFASAAGIELTHVPYKGTGPALTDLLGGHIPMAFAPIPATHANIAEGKLRGLAVTSAKRSSLLPDVPTIAEAGVPGFEASLYYGLVAPAGTPRPIIDKLNKALRTALATDEVRKRLSTDGAEPAPSSPEEYAAQIDREETKWSKVVKDSGAKAD
jgi:tripartite-type tricarboxylate transporter receptor subunit TctC